MKKVLVFGISILLLSLQSCDKSGGSSGSNFLSSAPTYEEKKVSIEDDERRNPLRFLSTDGTYRKNLWGEFVLEGTISNSATIAKYKDVLLQITYYSKTGSRIGSEKEMLYDFFPAGRSRSFKIKSMGYKGAKSLGWKIISAKATY